MEGRLVKDFKVGDVVYLFYRPSTIGSAGTIKKTTVKKVGRTWLTLGRDLRASVTNTTPCDCKQCDFGQTPTLYATKQAALDARDCDVLATKIELFSDGWTFRNTIKANNSPSRLRHVLATLEAAMSGGDMPVFSGEGDGVVDADAEIGPVL